MKKLSLLSTFVCAISLLPLAQKENSTHCSKRNTKFNSELKSNSLSVAQIAESEMYDVTFYALDIEMTNTSTAVAGTGSIYGTAKEPLDSVLFELFQSFNISEIRLNGTPTPYSRNVSAIKVPVNLTAGQTFQIEVDYDGTPPNQATNPLGGAGMTNDSSPSWGNQVTWSLSEPFSAYEWWPCKQSLRDKADSVRVHLTVPSTCKGGSNGTLENVVDLGNGTSRYEWMHRHPIDYYLVSVAVAEYVEYNVYANPTGAPNPILIQNFIYNNPNTLPYFQADIDETADFLELFVDLYGPYPFENEKYGHCMAPLSGGMEHQTMTTQGWFEAGLTAHELGHQWWGDHVTCASWADIWVNEGFASYSEYLMLENLYPGDEVNWMNSTHNNVKSQSGGSVWVQDSLNENRIFSGRLTYDKGAAIVHTMRYIVNDDPAFFQGLRDYQTIFADSTAIGLDFKDVMLSSTGVDLTDAFDQWYFGQGFPTYSVVWNTTGNDLVLEVSHTTSSTTPTFTNPIDIRMLRTGMSDTIVRVQITSNNDQFVIPGLGNVSNVVQVDPNNWIINSLASIQNDPNLLGINEESLSIDVQIYPNPSTGIFNVEAAYGEQFIQVFDTKGKLVLNKSFVNATTINLGEFDNGYYIVHITDSKGNTRIKTVAKN